MKTNFLWNVDDSLYPRPSPYTLTKAKSLKMIIVDLTSSHYKEFILSTT